mgnify:CR=1 FL=1
MTALECILHGQWMIVGALGRHGIERVSHGQNPRFEQDLFAFESLGISGSIPAFVVPQDDGDDVLKAFDGAKNASGGHDMLAHGDGFVTGQSGGLVDEFLLQDDFTDVMQLRRDAQTLKALGRKRH